MKNVVPYFTISILFVVSAMAEPLFTPEKDLLENTPPDFTRFHVGDHSEDAAGINR